MKRWNIEELKTLEMLCGQSISWQELFEKTKPALKERSKKSIQRKVQKNPQWIAHFKNVSQNTKKIDESILSSEEQKLLEELKGSSIVTIKEISRTLNIAKEDVFPLIDKLRNKGYEIEVASELEGERKVFLRKEPIPGQIHRLAPITKNTVKILVISDTCFGLRAQQGDLLATAYRIGEEEGVYIAIVAGNLSAGKPQFKRLGEYFLRTFEEQKDYIVSHWPKASFKTHFINGPTDLTFKTEKGQNIGYAIAQERNDLYYRGDKEALFLVGKDTRIAVVHLEGDTTDYTKSYALQGVTEGYQDLNERENRRRPKVVLVGGGHSLVVIPSRFPLDSKKKRDICSINIPSLYGITPTQRGKRKRGGAPVLGCWILTFQLNKEGNLKDIIFDARDLTAQKNQKNGDYLEKLTVKPDLSIEQKRILELLDEEPRTRGEICRILHKSTSYVQELIEGLKNEDYSIIFDEVEKRFKLEKTLKKEFKALALEDLYIRRAKTLDFGDLHLGHKKSRWDLVSEVYRIAKEEKVDEIHFCGDLVEGPGIKHGQLVKGEIDQMGADAQRNFALSIWPRSRIPTKIISGSSHDFEYMETASHNFAKTFAEFATLQKRGEISYVGEEGIWCRGSVEINEIGNLLYHPAGGIPLGLTYRGQINIEKLVPIIDEDFSTKVLKIGHLHIALFMQYKSATCLFVPALQEQTYYLAEKGLFPWIGFWVTEIFSDKEGDITRIILKYFPFEWKKEKDKKKA